MCCSTECGFGVAGQATVEAAVLLPTTLLLVGMLVQPVCLIYTRSVMRSAAAECARAMLSASVDEARMHEFALRRLAAVPDAALFHVGGQEDWSVELALDYGVVTARMSGHARPLPLFGMLAAVFCECDDDGIVLRVEIVEQVRPEWVGGDYAAWISMWK